MLFTTKSLKSFQTQILENVALLASSTLLVTEVQCPLERRKEGRISAGQSCTNSSFSRHQEL